ncbi:MAG: segregation/condensation protein A [Candidatus Marinimicrobia bacterium]|nr:segregation/condensation protein A [Candidatus Neomarinimicrobiota bacterium]
MAYSVHLENFEGPLDLLLYFIQRDKIDIYDIPIAHIAGEYLEYLGMIKTLKPAVAGEFVVLAASLMRRLRSNSRSSCAMRLISASSSRSAWRVLV